MWLVKRPSQSALQPLIRLEVDLGRVSLGSVGGSDIAISPDGTRLAYVSSLRLFTRQLNESNPTELAGTEEAQAPFFSPDSQWIAFGGPEGQKKVSVQGGEPILLSKSCSVGGGSWGPRWQPRPSDGQRRTGADSAGRG